MFYISLPTATTLLMSGIEIHIALEEFRNNSITITLELTVENSVISVEPQALDILNLGPMRVLVTLSHNTLYRVSVKATLCG